jgi:hypothetical protein
MGSDTVYGALFRRACWGRVSSEKATAADPYERESIDSSDENGG